MTDVIQVDFRGDVLFAVERPDGIFVAVKPICDSIGLNWRRQREQIQKDTVLSEGCTLEYTPTPGGHQEMLCLKIEWINGWLFKIDAARVKSEAVHEKVIAYQRECFDVLFAHFHGVPRADDREPTVEPELPGAIAIDGTPVDVDCVRLALNVVAQARVVHGKQAAQEIWAKLPLPQPSGLAGTIALAPGLCDVEATVEAFAEACLTESAGAFLPSSVAYDAYRRFCRSRRWPVAPINPFSRALGGFFRKRTRRHPDHGRCRGFIDAELQSAAIAPAA